MSPVSTVWAIVVAGGVGTRYGQGKNKLLEQIGGEPVLALMVRTLQAEPRLEGMVIVCHPQWEPDYREILEKAPLRLPLIWCHGGPTRRDSVYNGLCCLPQEAQVVVVHDAARPLVSPERIHQVIEPVSSAKALGSSLGVPCRNSLKQVFTKGEPWITRSIPREGIWQVHTPQVFQKEVLRLAHETVPHDPHITDDAELVERLYPDRPVVLMVEDDPTNIKITCPADLDLAERFLKQVVS